MAANTVEARVHRPTPEGVFVSGDTPEGVCDLAGNTYDRASSAFWKDGDEVKHEYPYVASDGREELDTSDDVQRVSRGGGLRAGAVDHDAATFYSDDHRPGARA